MREREGEHARHVIAVVAADLDGIVEVVVLDAFEDLVHEFRFAPRVFAEDEEQPLQHRGDGDDGAAQERPHDRAAVEEYFDHNFVV